MCNTTAVIFSSEAVKRQLCGVILSRLMVRGLLELEAAGLLDSTTQTANFINNIHPGAVSEDFPVLACIFSGENAAEKIPALVKNIEFAFGKRLIAAPENAGDTAAFMNAIAQDADKDNLLSVAPAVGEERTLLIIKPENFRQPSTRPGAIIDILMQLDLKWVGCKVHGMSISEALEFYGPVRQALRKKLAPEIGSRVLEKIENEFGFTFEQTQAQEFSSLAGTAYADSQFEDIVEFMSGKRPCQTPVGIYDQPAGAKCMVLIFDGVDAVAKIRKVLGPTNPAAAPGGTIRYDFGTDIMVNASHASDSQESYLRESSIVKVNENNLCKIAAAYK